MTTDALLRERFFFMDWFKKVLQSEAIETKERSALKGYRVAYGRYIKRSVGRKTNRTFFLALAAPLRYPLACVLSV